MARYAIEADHVWKEYRIRRHFQEQTSSLKEVFNSPFKKLTSRFRSKDRMYQNDTFWALRDVSFNIHHGESVGLIGRNGAGKSTLLKILSRITRPSQGRISLYERVNSLLEIGTGFNTELSGRDNIFLNGSFLGMKTSEIQSNFDEIVSFSEIEEFIDTPVKYYSSGMFVRLAFSVAVHLSPEILLLDEILSVGDAGFQHKSKKKMLDMLNCGATIVFVSHNEIAIKEICQRAIWLDHGSIKMDGQANEVLAAYMDSMM